MDFNCQWLVSLIFATARSAFVRSTKCGWLQTARAWPRAAQSNKLDYKIIEILSVHEKTAFLTDFVNCLRRTYCMQKWIHPATTSWYLYAANLITCLHLLFELP